MLDLLWFMIRCTLCFCDIINILYFEFFCDKKTLGMQISWIRHIHIKQSLTHGRMEIPRSQSWSRVGGREYHGDTPRAPLNIRSFSVACLILSLSLASSLSLSFLFLMWNWGDYHNNDFNYVCHNISVG